MRWGIDMESTRAIQELDLKSAREKIQVLESALLAMPQVEVPLTHYFAPGLYLREMTLQKHTVLTGKIHKTEHFCILSKGSVTVVTEEGKTHLRAPAVIHSMPGAKRAIHAHEDTVWVNVHHNPTDEKDLDRIEELFVANSYAEFLSFTEQKKLEGGK